MPAELAIEAARRAGDAILAHYRHELAVTRKDDGSPLTAADRASHQVIATQLDRSGVPVVSEEGSDLRLDASRYWLVDPLDGTKDFLAGNDEFTVNIALIDCHVPVLGVVFAPALDELYVGIVGGSAWCLKGGKREACLAAARAPRTRVAVSRFHDHPDVRAFADANHLEERVELGSALKYGRLALGTVDVFPRLVGSSEWDTAAGQAVLEAAGGQVLDWNARKPLRYGKPGRRNPRLLSLRAPYQASDFTLASFEQELS